MDEHIVATMNNKTRTFPELVQAVFQKSHDEDVDLNIARSMVIWDEATTDEERAIIWGDTPGQRYSNSDFCVEMYWPLVRAWDSGNNPNFLQDVAKLMGEYEQRLDDAAASAQG